MKMMTSRVFDEFTLHTYFIFVIKSEFIYRVRLPNKLLGYLRNANSFQTLK